ncbi:MAG: FMN-binding negative transcriptional regulator, partial [Alphaproteobacteria bacterium]|nr:FMN-binding negative transcriptional regulator [Alphaproteobacteria bacterium]
KLTPAKLTQMLAAIAVFTLPLTRLEGKFKLSQDKSQADRAGVMAALAHRPDPTSQSLVQAMETVPSR